MRFPLADGTIDLSIHAAESHGEKRPIATHCSLAAVWQELNAQELGRVYCAVDQAKYQGYNPDYEFIHTRNVLDGDEYPAFLIEPREVGDESKPAGRAGRLCEHQGCQ